MKTEAFLMAGALVLAGCAPVALGGGAVVASSVVQERSTMNVLNDNVIEVEIANALLNHSRQLYGDVAVKVVEGRVLLTGSVPTREDKIEAVRIAWGVEGVSSVEDELTVGEDSGTMAYLRDARISNTLRLKLLGDTKVSSVNYNVETVDGVVYLTGLARSKRELERVVWHARRVEGVERVVSHVLTIDDPRRTARVAAAG
jgi:osmotically-inducible protein OsmY